MKNLRPKFKILRHTADFKIKILGKTKKALFLNGLKSMGEILRVDFAKQKAALRKIKIKSSSLELLFVDFLNEVLYLIQTKREFYTGISFKQFTDSNLTAELRGLKIKRMGKDIKAVTYHDLSIKRRKDGFWEAVVLFDV